MGAQATTKAKKKINVHKTMNLRPFKLYRVCLDPLYLLNVGHFSLELNSYGLYPGSKKKSSCSYVHVLHKTFIQFHVVVVQWTSKKYTQSALYVQSCCFAHKINWFWLLSLSWCVSITIFCIVICFETNAGGIDYVLNNRLKCTSQGLNCNP